MIRFRSPSRRLLGLFVAVPFIAAACTTSASDGTDDAATAAAATDASTAVTGQGQAGPAAATEAGAEASWLDIELTDAETGEPFSLASLGGEVVAIEPMAIWCSNCRAQQDNVKEVYDQIEASGVTYISLGIDPGENPDSLAAYAERRGYEWTFAQSPVELSRALSDRFGPQILSAPSTPLIVLDSRGEVTFQDFGFHGPEQLLSILEEASA